MKSNTVDFFYSNPGTYDMTFYASDGGSNQATWNVGSISFKLPLFKGNEDILKQLPLIEHQFRPDASMPPAGFSWIYSVIVLAPWLFLISSVQ